MSIFDIDSLSNDFGKNLLEKLNRKIITDRLFPLGTVKQMAASPTGWGDLEMRFQVVSGFDGTAEREVRVRQRMHQDFFEVRYVQRTTGRLASRFYVRDEEDSRAIKDMIGYMTQGVLSTLLTRGACYYDTWLNNGEDGNDLLEQITLADFAAPNTPMMHQQI